MTTSSSDASPRRTVAATLTLTAIMALAALAALPVANAELVLHPTSLLRSDVPATRAAGTATFEASFHLTQAADIYLKVSPRPGNPVFDNGTVGEKGWWTTVELRGPDGAQVYHATSTGDPPMELGNLAANTNYTLVITAHAPKGSLATEGFHVLDYILAQHGEASTASSGGTLDQSIPLHTILHVEGTPEAKGGIPGGVWVFVLVLVAIGITALVLAGMRRRKDQPPAPPRAPQPPTGR